MVSPVAWDAALPHPNSEGDTPRFRSIVSHWCHLLAVLGERERSGPRRRALGATSSTIPYSLIADGLPFPTCYKGKRTEVAVQHERDYMAKKQQKIIELKIERPERVQLAPQESLKRMQNFLQRKERFVAVIREGKSRSVSARSA